MKVAILSAGRGWHTDELAARLRGARPRGPPPADPGPGGAHRRSPRPRGGRRGLDGCDAVLVRIIPRGSLEQIVFRIDALHWLESAGRRGREPGHRDRAHGRQVLHVGAPRAGGAADAAHRRGGAPGRGHGRVRGDARRDRQAALRLERPRHGAGERRGDRLSRVQGPRAGARRLLRAAGAPPRGPRRARLRRGRPRRGGRLAHGRRLAHQPRARRRAPRRPSCPRPGPR